MLPVKAIIETALLTDAQKVLDLFRGETGYATPKIGGKYQQVTAVNPDRLDDAVHIHSCRSEDDMIFGRMLRRLAQTSCISHS